MNQDVQQEIRILDGSSFFVSDSLGNAHADRAHGLYFKDTRFLSANILRINGETPALLSTKNIDYFSARFFLTLPFGTTFDTHPVSIVRSRLIGQGATEQVLIQNNSEKAIDLMVSLHFDADFADLFEVKGADVPKVVRHIETRTRDSELLFTYSAENFSRATVIEFSEQPILVEKVAYFKVHIERRHVWELNLSISPVLDYEKIKPKYSIHSFGKARPEMDKSMNEWLNGLPSLKTDMDYLKHGFNHSSVDLAALRFRPNDDEEPVLAAGLPWFMALFGRDNLITCYQTCFMAPEMAQDAISSLAKRQGTQSVDFTDEDPGKILHEFRFDQLTKEGKLPYNPYYGSADSTVLFLILLHEFYCWTANDQFVRAMEQPARKALEWIDRYGDMDGDGFVEYKTRSSMGLVNQCWKDSWNSILFSDGTIAKPPIAVCEIQGYVYDAKMRCASLAQLVWKDEKLAADLRAQAHKLKETFNREFWTSRHGGYFVLALDKDKKQVDSRTSNMGQLLWSGIVKDELVPTVVKQLFSDPLYSGWGVRTMSTADKGFNPITYHNGTVWPHDNSLIATGLARHGHRQEANKIAVALIEAAQYFGYRLPETFAGYSRRLIDYPVEYPTACSPQAWATGAIPLLLRTVLGLRADPIKRSVEIDPLLPEGMNYIQLENLRLFGDVFQIYADRDHHYIDRGTPKHRARQHIEQYRQAAS